MQESSSENQLQSADGSEERCTMVAKKGVQKSQKDS